MEIVFKLELIFVWNEMIQSSLANSLNYSGDGVAEPLYMPQTDNQCEQFALIWLQS